MKKNRGDDDDDSFSANSVMNGLRSSSMMEGAEQRDLQAWCLSGRRKRETEMNHDDDGDDDGGGSFAGRNEVRSSSKKMNWRTLARRKKG